MAILRLISLFMLKRLCILHFVAINPFLEVFQLKLGFMPHFLMLVHEIIGRKFCSAYFTGKILHVQIFDIEKLLIILLYVHSNRIDVSPERNSCVHFYFGQRN